MSLQPKRKRKQRVVNNAYIDIDSVTTEPGPDYCNWIDISKRKLKEREAKLLSIKIKEIQQIVNTEAAKFGYAINTRFTIPDSIIHRILLHLYGVIHRWNGVNLCRIKKVISTFRDYFVIGKNWWDLTKKKLMGNVFWLTIFKHIQQVFPRESYPK